MCENKKHTFELEAIGYYHSNAKYAYDAPRQANLSRSEGKIILNPHQNYEQALQDLSGFSHIWLVYIFHHNNSWKPLVDPPRGDKKVGVFASRAPYRPNPIGISCVEILGLSKREIIVAASDLLDQTPIVDIKPYLPYCDSIPGAKIGWVNQIPPSYKIEFSNNAMLQILLLEDIGIDNLKSFIVSQLSDNPVKSSKKRIYSTKDDNIFVLGYRTWRIHFELDNINLEIVILKISSAYSESDLDVTSDDFQDKYHDKIIHRRFLEANKQKK